jgi:hypothetical protein
MNISAVSSLFPNWARLQGTTSSSAVSSSSASQASSISERAGTAAISPLAQFMSRLQQLQQQNPDLFKQVAANLATRLQKAAQNAQSSGDTTRAAQLNQLATVLRSSAQSGQLPSLQDLQQAGFGEAQHHQFGNVLASVLGTQQGTVG